MEKRIAFSPTWKEGYGTEASRVTLDIPPILPEFQLSPQQGRKKKKKKKERKEYLLHRTK